MNEVKNTLTLFKLPQTRSVPYLKLHYVIIYVHVLVQSRCKRISACGCLQVEYKFTL